MWRSTLKRKEAREHLADIIELCEEVHVGIKYTNKKGKEREVPVLGLENVVCAALEYADVLLDERVKKTMSAEEALVGILNSAAYEAQEGRHVDVVFPGDDDD